MTENRFTMPEGGLIKAPRPADRETRFPAPAPGALIRHQEENA